MMEGTCNKDCTRCLKDLEEKMDMLMINTIKNPKIDTREKIEGYLECQKDALAIVRNHNS